MFVISLTLAFLASTLGASLVFLSQALSEKMMSIFYGLAAGIMLFACFYSLLLPALDSGQTGLVLTFLAGVGLLFLIDHLILHESALTHEVEGVTGPRSSPYRLVITMIMHNIPQGLALGIAFQAKETTVPIMLTIGLLMQNLPEGAASAIPLVASIRSPAKVFMIAQLISFLEIPAAVIGYHLAGLARSLLPYLFSFAAGIMLYTIIEEIIPDAWSHHHRPIATLAIFGGLSLMLLIYLFFEKH